jgi:hypothetical protein
MMRVSIVVLLLLEPLICGVSFPGVVPTVGVSDRRSAG